MKTYRFVCLVLVGFTLSSFAADKPKVLFIGHKPDHPHGTHMYLHTCEILAKCVALNGDIETVVSDGWPKDKAVLDGVKSIVVYSSPGAEFMMDRNKTGQFEGLMKEGVGLVTIHWASAVRKENFKRLGQLWMYYLGGTWVSNVGIHTDTEKLKQLVPDHPVCRGWSDYELRDEFYLNPTIGSNGTPLLQVRTRDREVVVGWAGTRDKGGRSYATTLGHFYANFLIEDFRKAIVNGILWTAHIEVPEEGADVQLSEEELAIPEKEEKKK
ncbi:MAG: ThuA domain-containing protein [Verrucomicrobiota bacterium]